MNKEQAYWNWVTGKGPWPFFQEPSPLEGVEVEIPPATSDRFTTQARLKVEDESDKAVEIEIQHEREGKAENLSEA